MRYWVYDAKTKRVYGPHIVSRLNTLPYFGPDAVVRDASEQHRAERALRDSEERYRELIENMGSGVAVYEAVDKGKDFVFKGINRAVERIEKVRREDILGKRVRKVFPGVEKFGIFRVFQQVWRTGKPQRHPVKLYKDERIQGWRENYVYKLPSGDVVAVYEDVTERVRTLESLAESKSMYRQLFDQAKDAIFIADPETGRIVDANAAAGRLLKRPARRIIGMHQTEVHPREKADHYRRKFEQHVRAGRMVDLDAEVVRKDGTVVPVAISATVIEVQGRRLIQGIFSDLTEFDHTKKRRR